MCMGIVDMRWQFGGNFQPVRVICTEDWKKCLIAISKYLWSEVVTEVVDYLTDDIFVWKVLMAVIVFVILIHTVYYKLRWVDEKSSNKENLNKVGFKVQDLELKVNILTYKMQYGTWPLPHHICKSDIKSDLQNIRLTLTNPEDRNSWIKHLLLSSRKIKDYNFSNKNLVPSIKNLSRLVNLETKYISSKLQNQIPSIESGDQTDKSSGDNSISKWKRCKNLEPVTFLKNNSKILNDSINSNETFVLKEFQVTKQKEKRARNHSDNQKQNQESPESCSGNTNTCSVKRLREKNQMKEDSSGQSEKSDMNCRTKMNDEGHLEKLEDLEMEKPTKAENSPESQMEDISSTNENESLTDDTLRENSNFLSSNLNINFLVKTISRPSSIDKSNLTNTQETLDQVREKLESLHDILLTYESSDCEQNNSCSLSKSKDSKSRKSSISLNMDVKENIITEEVQNCSDSEQFESLVQSSSTSSIQSYSNMSNVQRKTVIHNPNYNRIDSSDPESEDEKAQKVFESEGKISTNTFTKISVESKSSTSEVKSEFVLEPFDINSNNNRITMSQTACNTDYKSVENDGLMDTSDDQFSQCSSQIEFSNGETLDNQLPSSYLRENLQSKVTFVCQQKIEKEFKTIQENIVERKENNDFEKSFSPNIESNFQTKLSDILPEEQSTSSLTLKTSKKSDEEDFTSCQNMEESSKSVLSSTSSEYFSFVNLFHTEKMSRDFKTNEKKIEASNQGTDNVSDQENCINSKQITYLKKERIKQEKINETVKDNKNESTPKNCELDTEAKRVGNKNSNIFAPTTDSSSDESLTQFIRELTSDKIKIAQVFKESKYSLNLTKSNEKLFNIEEAQEQESILSLQRRPGSFSLGDDESREKLLNAINVDQSSNSKTNFSMEISTNYQTNEKNKADELEEKRNINKRNEEINSFENVDIKLDFDSNDSDVNPRLTKTNNNTVDDNLREQSINDDKNEDSVIEIIEVFETKNKFLEPSQQKKSEISLNRKTFKDLENQEMVDNSQSNLISDPSSSLYFTPSNSDEKSEDNLLTNISVLSTNLEVQEAILQDTSELLESKEKAKVYEKECKVTNQEQTTEEVMLIDLTDNDISNQVSEMIKSDTCSTNRTYEIEKLNILDEILDENDIENVCLVPKKIHRIEEFNVNNNNNQSESGSYTETNSKNYLSTSGNSFFGKSTDNYLHNKVKIPEMNKFSDCSSASSLQDFLWNAKKSSTMINSKPKYNVETPVKRTKLSTSRDKFVEKAVDNNRKSVASRLTENPCNEKQLRTRSYLNLNLGKEKFEKPIQRRSRSFASPRMIQRDSNNFKVEEQLKSEEESIQNPIEMDKTRFTSRTSIKSIESQKSSKSCIPILRSRLENIRKQEPKPRYRSPTRGPLTINPAPDELDLKVTSYLNDRRKLSEGDDSNEKSFGDNTGPVLNLLKEKCPKPDEKTVIYINIMTGQDQSTRKVVNPKKFLEFMKDREMRKDNFTNKEKSRGDSQTNIHKLISVTESDELSKRNLMQSKFLFHVEQKEREVSVKPSVIDNSTSVSDFPEFCNNANRGGNKFKIFDVPEELTKDEYIHLLDLLNQDPNLEQLRKMRSLCNKLGLGFQE